MLGTSLYRSSEQVYLGARNNSELKIFFVDYFPSNPNTIMKSGIYPDLERLLKSQNVCFDVKYIYIFSEGSEKKLKGRRNEEKYTRRRRGKDKKMKRVKDK